MNTKDITKCLLFEFICLLFYLIVTYHFIQLDYIFNANNFLISLIIFVLFSIGYINLLKLTLNLASQSTLLTKLERQNTDLLDNFVNKLPNGWIKNYIDRIKINNINGKTIFSLSTSVIQNDISTTSSVIKYISGILILVGLLGTFLGIIKSVKGLEGAINLGIYSNQNFDHLFTNITQVLNGLDKAFGTSIIGIISYIILSFAYTIYKKSENKLAVSFKNIAISKIIPFYQKLNIDPLAQIIITSINKTLPNVVKESSEALKESSNTILEVSEMLHSSQKSVSSLTQTFQKETKKLIEINVQFSTDVKLIKDTLTLLNSSINENQKVFNGMYIKNTQIHNQILESHKELSDYLTSRENQLNLSNNILEKLNSNIVQNQEVFNKLSNSINSNMHNSSKINLSIERSYKNLQQYVSSVDLQTKSIQNENAIIIKTLNNHLDVIKSMKNVPIIKKSSKNVKKISFANISNKLKQLIKKG